MLLRRIRTLLDLVIAYEGPLRSTTSGSSQLMNLLYTTCSILSKHDSPLYQDAADYVADFLACFFDGKCSHPSRHLS